MTLNVYEIWKLNDQTYYLNGRKYFSGYGGYENKLMSVRMKFLKAW